MTLKVEAGKFYVDGLGSIIGPMIKRSSGIFPFKGEVDGQPGVTRTYMADGTWLEPTIRCGNCLVKLYVPGAEMQPTLMSDLSLPDYQRLYRAFEKKQRPWLAD